MEDIDSISKQKNQLLEKKVIAHVAHHFREGVLEDFENDLLKCAKQDIAYGYIPVIHTSCAFGVPGRTVVDGVIVVRHRYGYPHFFLSKANRQYLDEHFGDWVSHCLWRNLLKEKNLLRIQVHGGGRMARIAEKAAHRRAVEFVATPYITSVAPIPKSLGNCEWLADWALRQ